VPQLLYLNPTRRASDVRALAEWYRHKLGFEIHFLWQDPPTHAVIGRDSIRIGIAPRDSRFGPCSVYVHTSDVSALYAEFLARGTNLSGEPSVTPYGTREFEVTDPDGNRLCFGEALEATPPR
jgi:uncharacterized glyoxalase superfamily protein PhnB